jgi:DNA-binding Lrp family transcriptional regulator
MTIEQEEFVDPSSSKQQSFVDPDSVSRFKLLEELAKLGVDTEAFKSFSITELSDLLYGLNRVIGSYKNNNNNDGRISRTNNNNIKERSVPVLSLTDCKILKSLLSSAGRISSLKLSRELDIPLSTVQRRRKRLEDTFLHTSYALKVEKFGWRKATLFLSTQHGLTSSVAKELLAWHQYPILSISRTMGANEIDLHLEFIFRQNSELLDLIEKIRAIEGVKNVIWNESIEVIGTNQSSFETIIDNY